MDHQNSYGCRKCAYGHNLCAVARWFKQGQKWRTGCEGHISVLKRRHGLARSRYRGSDGMRRWVGLGIIADNLINLGGWLAPQPV
jgi:transposase, IS5 family